MALTGSCTKFLMIKAPIRLVLLGLVIVTIVLLAAVTVAFAARLAVVAVATIRVGPRRTTSVLGGTVAVAVSVALAFVVWA